MPVVNCESTHCLTKVGLVELLSEYGLFLAKIVTVVVAIAVIAVIIVNVAQRNKRQRGELRVNNLSEQYKEMKEELAAALMDPHQQKQWHKAQKKKHKQEAKAAKAKAKLGEVLTEGKPRVWVLDFKGSMDAHEVNSLREEITAVLAAFKPQDQVVLRLESPGGVVHGYGLARIMAIEIKVPDIGADEVEITEILVKVGDKVEAEQSLITVEGDKASMEVPSPQAGIVKEINVSVPLARQRASTGKRHSTGNDLKPRRRNLPGRLRSAGKRY